MVLGCTLAGCAVGPNFKAPAPPKVTGYSQQPLPTQISDEAAHEQAQRFVQGMDIPGQWWTLFHSTALNELVREALDRNPTVTAAQASLRQANETVSA
jgi:outer membrane protein TolC